MAARGTYGHNDAVKIFLPVVSEQNNPERLTEGIAADGAFTQWELTSGVLTKYYATVGPIAAPLDAVFALIRQHDIKAGDIEEIHADCTRRTAIFNNPKPDTDHTARASLPYCIAVAACTRDPALLLGPAYQPSMLANAEFQAMARRVRITANEDYERQYPARSLCRITITLRGGAQYSLEVDRTANPRYLKPSDADIESKFRLIAEPVLGKVGADRVVALVSRIDTLPDVRELVDALRPR
jgi:2-methylcitrate dehydratase PrpD